MAAKERAKEKARAKAKVRVRARARVARRLRSRPRNSLSSKPSLAQTPILEVKEMKSLLKPALKKPASELITLTTLAPS